MMRIVIGVWAYPIKSLTTPVFLILLFFSFITETLYANPYSILGISPNATEEEVLRAYREKAKQSHPDRSSLPAELATKQFKLIQAAYEEIKEMRRSPEKLLKRSSDTHQREIEKEIAKQAAQSFLKQAWVLGTFGESTISELPVLSKLLNSKVVLPHGRGAKEEGEWEAVREFLNNHQQQFLDTNPDFQQVASLLRDIDLYMDYNGETVKDIRAGFTAQLEDWLMDHAATRDQFLEQLAGRFNRLSRAGSFPLSNSTDKERSVLSEKPNTIFAQKFGGQKDSGESLSLQIAHEMVKKGIANINSNPLRVHELDFLVRSVPASLNEEERLRYLGDLKLEIESLPNAKNTGFVKEFTGRIDRAVNRIFEKNPKLKREYAQKASLWNRIWGSPSNCDMVLGRLTRFKH